MRKKLALLLVLALIVSMVPMSVFAASKNEVSKVVKVKDDHDLNDTDVPYVKIKNDANDFSTTERFRLKLETADWLDDGDEVTKNVYENNTALVTETTEKGQKKYTINDFEEFMAAQIVKYSYAKEKGGVGKLFDENTDVINVRRSSDSTIEITIEKNSAVKAEDDAVGYAKDDEIRVPLFVSMDGKGDAKVTIEPMDSNVSGGTYTFAVGAGGDTITTIDDIESFADAKEIKTIQIDEAAIKAIDRNKDRKVKLKLPTNFKWVSGKGKVTFGGSFKDNVTLKDGKKENLTSENLTSDCFVDDRTIEFYVNISAGAPNTRGTIYISGLVIDADKNAKTGDVKMTISGDDITTEDIIVAKYVDYDVIVEAKDEPTELFAGRYDDVKFYTDDKRDNEAEKAVDYKYPKTDSDDHKLAKLRIEEDVANSWLTNRKTRIEFPTWVKILNVEVTDSDNFEMSGSEIQDAIHNQLDVEDNYIEFSLEKDDSTDTAMLELQFYVSIEAGRSGDIEAVVGGKALDQEYTVVLGKAIAPIAVEAAPVDIRTGIKNQALNKITITENKAGALVKDGHLELVLEEGMKWTEVPNIEVVEGDVDLDIDGAKIGKTDNNDDTLRIKVKNDSSKASVIEITDAKVDLTRYVAEGNVELKVTGDAVVQNNDDKVKLELGGFKEDNAAKVVVAKVVTPADQNVGVKEVVFTIGEATFTVDGVEQTMDTAPYIKDGRTMLPVRYVAQALGVPEDNVVWNPVTRTVTIFKGDRVVLITIGSAELKVNGTPIYMDTVAEIKDGRTMLPISFIGKALGAEVTWDAEARTVTIK